MKITRLDLDGATSPQRLARRIHQVEDLPLALPLEALCAALDIQSIKEMQTAGFEGALVTDEIRSSGHILVSANSPRRRQRFSIAHELGHFLIETHKLQPGGRIECSLADLHSLNPRDRDSRRRMEAEANTFAAHLLMPPRKIRQGVGELGTSLETLVAMAYDYDVSKEAMARAFIQSHHDPIAIIVSRKGRTERFYRHDDFPYLPVTPGKPLPPESFASASLNIGSATEIEEVDPEDWLDSSGAERTLALTEQALGQTNGYALTLLQAELDDDE